MSKTLKELGEEYLEEANLIGKKIESYRSRLKKAVLENDSDEIYTVRSLLCVFYAHKNELTDNARILMNYYS